MSTSSKQTRSMRAQAEGIRENARSYDASGSPAAAERARALADRLDHRADEIDRTGTDPHWPFGRKTAA